MAHSLGNYVEPLRTRCIVCRQGKIDGHQGEVNFEFLREVYDIHVNMNNEAYKFQFTCWKFFFFTFYFRSMSQVLLVMIVRKWLKVLKLFGMIYATELPVLMIVNVVLMIVNVCSVCTQNPIVWLKIKLTPWNNYLKWM